MTVVLPVGMKKYVIIPPLVKVTVYLYPKERQSIRMAAARNGLSMSAYIKALHDKHGGKL